MVNPWIITKLEIENLTLWDENARFSDQYFNQPENILIKHFLSTNFKVKELAEKIVKDFDLPQLEKFVVYRYGNKNIVLEGNRRLTAYKLLANPNLIEDIILKKTLIELNRKTKITNEFAIECLVTDNLEQGYRYIERKHLNKNNEVPWGDNERTHYKERRGKASEKEQLKVEVTKIVNNSNLNKEIKEKVLGPRYVTTFWRLMQQTPAQTVFGFSFDDQKKLKIKDDNFDKKLKVVIWDVLQKGKYNGKLFSRLTNSEIESYLNSISEKRYKNIDKEIKKSKKTTLYGEELTFERESQVKRRTPITKQVNILFGKKLALKSGPVNNLYCGIYEIYEKFDGQEIILPIIAMSLRLLLDIAAKNYFIGQGNNSEANKDSAYKKFLKEAKKQLSKEKENSLSLNNEWLSDKRNLDATLSKYAHGSIVYKHGDILKDSIIIADILEYYFKK